MKITWYGTASLALESSGGSRLLLDPFFRMNDALPRIPAQTFTGFDGILLTHGHVDHIYDVPKVAAADPSAPIYCTRAPRRSLIRMGVPAGRIRLIAPEQRFTVGDFSVTVRQGRHVRFDLPYIAASAPQCFRAPVKAVKLIASGVTLPERGEIVVYEIRCDGKTVTVMGSFGVDENTAYETEPDLLVLPYNGSMKIPKLADAPLRQIRPKKVFLDHFDDAFPPLTRRMDAEGYSGRLSRDFPQLAAVVPVEREAYEVG